MSAGDRHARPTRLGEILRAALARLPAGRDLAHYEVWTHWESAVGPAIARHAWPERLHRGVLVVAVDGPEWMQELQFLKRELQARLNERLGRPVVRQIYLSVSTGR